jgi:hypothetical protein
MKKLAAALVLVSVLGLSLAPPAAADASTDAALALGAFAVFNQLVRGETVLSGIFGPPPVVVPAPPPVVYAPPPVVYAPPRPVVYAPPPAVIYAPPVPVVVKPAPRVIYRPAPVYSAHPRWGWTHRAGYWNKHDKDRRKNHHRRDRD